MRDPIIIWACGFRTGTTLVQRLVCSASGCIIWGESNGALPLVVDAYLRMADWLGWSDVQREQFRRKGAATWIANMHPPLLTMMTATRAWLQTMYARMPDGSEARVWGVKEPRLEAPQLGALWSVFPDMRVVFLLRDPRAMVASMHGTGWYPDGSQDAVATWARRVDWVTRQADRRLLTVRYEQLVTDPDAVLVALADHIGVAREALDRRVLGQVVRGTSLPPVLNEAAEIALRAPELAEIAARVGYAVGGRNHVLA